MDWSIITDVLISLLTLTFLEVILGIDNLVFISIAVNRLAINKQKFARRLGLLLALATRLLLLASVLWMIKLTRPLFTVMGVAFSVRDLFLIGGGLFLLYKSTFEIHTEVEGKVGVLKGYFSSIFMVVIQIAVLDIIFSLDSVFTAVGMTQNYWIMATAITITIIAMLFASEPLSAFVTKRPTVKMLALSFLLLIGTVLIADGFHFHVPRQYIYFALTFSLLVEMLNTLRARKRRKKTLK